MASLENGCKRPLMTITPQQTAPSRRAKALVDSGQMMVDRLSGRELIWTCLVGLDRMRGTPQSQSYNMTGTRVRRLHHELHE